MCEPLYQSISMPTPRQCALILDTLGVFGIFLCLTVILACGIALCMVLPYTREEKKLKKSSSVYLPANTTEV